MSYRVEDFDSMVARCWAEIDLSALIHNAAAVRAHLGVGVHIMAIVKADAYGHGMHSVVAALRDRVELFGVANVHEACELSAQVAASRIYILGPALPEERPEIVARGFIATVSSVAEARAYGELTSVGQPMRLHLAVDTGMGRIGVWQDEAVAVAREIQAVPGVSLEGVASHLPVSDEDDAYTQSELERFHDLVAELREQGLRPMLEHVENSAGIIGFPAQSGGMVRAGLVLYGCAPRPEFQGKLEPVLTWKTRVTLVRDVAAGRGISYGRTFITPAPMRIATLAVGYADGYQRHLSGCGAEVLIGGRRCAVLGRITMDQILVDVTALPDVVAGDEVVLLGRQRAEEILVAELAGKAGTIPWEIFTGIGPRVVRRQR